MADKNLRFDSQFSMIGAFWSPQTPDAIIKGTLVSDKREINFTTAPEYERPIVPGRNIFAMPDQTPTPALHGFCEDGLITLCHLVEQRGPGRPTTLSGKPSGRDPSGFSPVLAACTSINGVDDKCLSSARCTFEGLSAWFPQAFDEKWETDRVVVTVPFDTRQIQDFCLLDSQVRITVKVFPELTSGDGEVSKIACLQLMER